MYPLLQMRRKVYLWARKPRQLLSGRLVFCLFFERYTLLRYAMSYFYPRVVLTFVFVFCTSPAHDPLRMIEKKKPIYGQSMSTEEIVRKFPNWILSTPRKALGWHLNLTAGTVPAANYLRTYFLRH